MSLTMDRSISVAPSPGPSRGAATSRIRRLAGGLGRWLVRGAGLARLAVAFALGFGMVAGAIVAAPRVAPGPVVTASAGLASADWRAETPVEVRDEFQLLLRRESAATTGATMSASTSVVDVPAAAPAGGVAGGGRAVAVALRFALAQRGKPYLWGAEGPDQYDCSGLTMRSYGQAGVVLPRTSVSQAQVGTPVRLTDLKPGDLVFWAYNPADLSTVHHVALYLGGGQVVHAPQTGDVVKVSSLWLTGYAGAVRVAAPGSVVLPNGVILPRGLSLPGGTDTSPGVVAPGDPRAPAPSGTPSPGTTAGATPEPSPSGTPTPSGSATPPPATTDPAPTTPDTGPTTAPPTPDPTTPPPTTDPAPTTEPAPPTTDPAPTTTDPAPATTDPGPAPSTSDPAPPTTEATTAPTTDPATVAPTTEPAAAATSEPAAT